MRERDESLIRDADLRERLEASRGNVAFESLVGVLIHTQKERDKNAEAEAQKAATLAAMPREKRRRAQVREVFENAAPSPADIRHLHSVFAVCGLPYERLPNDERRFERRQGNTSLLIQAGELLAPDGSWQPQPLPFGPKARLILMHLCSEAVRQKSATIELADTFTAFVRDMGFADNGGRGGALTAFREQLNSLAACKMTLGTFTGVSAKMLKIDPIESFDLWLSPNPNQRSLWPSTLTFTPSMFESLSRHAMPVNVKAVRAFAGSARKLDLYFWLGYRLHNIERPLHVSWKALAEQFGGNFTRQVDFKRKLTSELHDIAEVFPRLPAKLTENGMTIRPAGPEVLALPAPRPAKKS